MRWPILAVILGVSACGAPAHPSAPAATSPAEHTARFRSWGWVHAGYGVDPLTDEQSRGRWHWLLRFRDGFVTEATEITPAGARHRRRVLARDASGALTVRDFDAYGVQVAVTTVDAAGRETIVHRSGVVGADGCHHRRLVPDAHGRPAESSCFDEDDRPYAGLHGCEKLTEERNPAGHVIHGQCFRADGTRATFRSGQHEYFVTTNDVGDALELRYVDLDGQPKATGCAKATQEYAPNGLLARKRCTTRTGAFDVEARWAYDANGCTIETSRVDAFGKPTLDNGVYATVTVRDARCEELRRETRGVAGELVGTPAVREYERDERGRMKVQRCRDTLLKPISCLHGVGDDRAGAVVRYEYDDRDRVTAHRCYSAGGEPSGCSVNYPFEERTEYDDKGREHAQSFFDELGRPALALGAARVITDYDGVGNVAAKRYFGVHAEPVIASIGCHEIRTLRDAHHQVSSIECRGPDQKLREASLCFGATCFAPGAARVVVERETFNKIFNVYYDAAGKQLLRASCDDRPCFR